MRVLHLLSQRPSLTGSGVTLDALVRCASAAGWEQCVVIGTPATDPSPPVGGLPTEAIRPLVFGAPPLCFPLPGMSDVMPYESTLFSALSVNQIEAYDHSLRRHIAAAIDAFAPDLIHSHHVWLMSSMLKDIAPSIPAVTHCHATGFRQMELCPHLADRVRRGCARNDRFAVLHRGHARELADCLDVPPTHVGVVGAGYRDDLFNVHGRNRTVEPAMLFVGKLCAAKGLPQLLDAVARLPDQRPPVQLHVVGGGTGEAADALRSRMEALAPRVVAHGRLSQPAVADLARRCTVCILPSFFEGVPLVLVEALACGCRLVASALAGVEEELAPRLGTAIELVAPPPMAGAGVPKDDFLPDFVDRITTAIERALALGPIDPTNYDLGHFAWSAVFQRIQRVWRQLL